MDRNGGGGAVYNNSPSTVSMDSPPSVTLEMALKVLLASNVAVVPLMVLLPFHVRSIAAPNTIIAEMPPTLEMTHKLLFVLHVIVMPHAIIWPLGQSPITAE
jgi:hypothetical protein